MVYNRCMAKLIFSQGNLGPEYTHSRHNIGFLALDCFKEQHNLPDFHTKTKFQAEVSESSLTGEKVVLAKPTTFYNLTGQSARAIVDFYKISPQNILVIHDELSLDFGTLRVRPSGSDAGNKGIRSLNQHLGPDYWRLRVGIHNELASTLDVPDFVLAKFTKKEQETLQKSIVPKINQVINDFLQGKLESTSYDLR